MPFFQPSQPESEKSQEQPSLLLCPAVEPGGGAGDDGCSVEGTACCWKSCNLKVTGDDHDCRCASADSAAPPFGTVKHLGYHMGCSSFQFLQCHHESLGLIV